MTAIVAVDEHWGIGRDGGMLFHLPEDLAFFRRTTTGNTVVMGYTTLQALPGAKPLPNRLNIILTRDAERQIPGALVCHSLPQLFQNLKENAQGHVFIAGGEAVYRQLLPYCDAALVTKIHADGRAQKFFPNLDQEAGWRMVQQGEPKRDNGLAYMFCRYEKA